MTVLRSFGMDAVPAVNAQTGTSYTLALTDTVVTCSNASAITVTVPANGTVAFPIGKEIEVEQAGAGQVTFSPGVGVTLNSASGNLSISAHGGKVRLRKTGTNVWHLSGDLTVTSNVIYRAGQSSLSGTIAKTAVVSFTLPGGKLSTNKCLCIEVAARFSSVSTTHTLGLELTYGGTAMWGDTCTAQTANASDHPVFLRFYLYGNAATNAQRLVGMANMGTSAAASSGLGDLAAIIANATGFDTPIAGSAAVDSTSNQTINLNATLSATTNSTFSIDYVCAYMVGEGQKGDTGAQGIQGVGASSITFNEQSGTTYTLALTDKGQCVNCSNASSITVTVPTNATAAFAVGDVVYVRQGDAGAVTLAAAGGVTLQYPYSLTTGAQYAWLALCYKGSDVWAVTGQSL